MHAAGPIYSRILTSRPPRIAMVLVLLAAAAQIVPPGHWGATGSYPAAAATTGIVGFMLMIRAWWLFRVRQNAICPTADTTVLITDDVYRVTRNPMYLGILGMIVGVGLMAGSVFYFLGAAVFFLIIDRSFCPYEERKLRRLFGPEFERYASKVRRWV